MTKRRLLVALFVGTAIGATCHGQQRLEEKLPADTRLCISIPNAKRLNDDWSKTTLSELVGQPKFAEFRNELSVAAADGVRPLLSSIGWSDVAQMATGPVVFAMVGERGGSLIALTTDQDANARSRINALADELHAAGAAMETDQIHGHDVTVATLKARPSASASERLLAYASGVFYLTDDRQLLDRMLQPSPTTSSMGQLAWFRSMNRRAEIDLPQRHLSWWIQGDAMEWLVGLERPFESSGASLSSLATLRAARGQGFESIRAIGGSVILGDQNHEVVAETYVYRDGPLQKAARMLATVSRPLDTITLWSRGQLSQITRWNLDWPNVVEGYASWFDATYGEGEDGVFDMVLDDIRDEPDSPKVDVRGEILLQFGSHLTAYRSSDESLGSSVRIYSIPLHDAPRVAHAVGKMLEGDTDVTRKTIHGTNVWHYGDLTKNTDEPILGPDLSGWAMAIIGDHFVLANDIRAIENLLQGKDAVRTGLPGVVEMAQKSRATEGTSGWQFARIPQIVRPSYQALRSGRAQDTVLGRFAARVLRTGGAPLDFKTLPAWSSIELPPGAVTSLLREVDDGWRVTTTVQLDTR